jgi:murein L,D-transpeptidase YafK
MLHRVLIAAGLFFTAIALAACGGGVSPANMPIPQDTLDLMKTQGLKKSAPIFVRIFKRESELEVWKQRDDGRYALLKTYPICKWSGRLGPKLKQGDKQAPEGFYTVSARQMNPNSSFHLSFNLGYPNKLDKAYNRTGNFLMVHGDCRSAGCYAMTDVLIEEIYAIAREAFAGGQKKFQVQALPFRMNDENMKRYARGKWSGFWRDLKKGSDAFEITSIPPKIDICERRYLINASFSSIEQKFGAREICPPYQTFVPEIMETPEGPKIIQALVEPNHYNARVRNSSAVAVGGYSRRAGNRSFATPRAIALRNSMGISR